MSQHENKPPREKLKTDLERTAACIGLSRLDEPLTEAERTHVASCVRCQTELSMFEEFQNATPASDEGAAVAWITAALRRRGASEPDGIAAKGSRDVLSRPVWRLLSMAATVVLVVAIGYLAWDREPALRDPTGSETYRTGQVRIIGPSGDVPSPPLELAWVAVSGAERYDVSILEVDRTPLWRGTSSEPRIELPKSLTARFVPGKTVIWEVSALDRSSAVIAVSGAQRFRVNK